MQILICAEVSQFPAWLSGHALENAAGYLEEDGCAIVARRADGQVQTIPEGYIDADVMRSLLLWAAGQNP